MKKALTKCCMKTNQTNQVFKCFEEKTESHESRLHVHRPTPFGIITDNRQHFVKT